MVDFKKIGQESAIERRFTTPLQSRLQVPVHAKDNEVNRKSLIDGLNGAAMRPVPKDWEIDRCEVYGDRLLEEVINSLRSRYWPRPEQVFDLGAAVVADMTKFDRMANGMPGFGVVPAWFPDFYAQQAQSAARPIEDSPYMQQQKLAWIARYGAWPLDDKHKRRRTEPLMGEEPGYPEFRARMLRQYALTPEEMRWIELADRRYRVKNDGAEPVMI